MLKFIFPKTNLFVSALFGALVLFFVSTTSASAALFINEFASDTAGTTVDPDWVEIYNSGPDSVDLGLYRLRDNTTNIKDLSGTIIAGGFATVDWINRLDKTGDVIRLLLIADETTPVDRVGYGNAGTDVTAPGSGQSAGRSVDGAGQWVIFQTPTKGSPNLVSQSFILAWGNNLVGLTVDKGTNYLAENFLADLNSGFVPQNIPGRTAPSGNKVLSVTRWHNGRYQTHSVGTGDLNNFPIVAGEGYFIRTNWPGQASLSGLYSTLASIAIPAGYSMISFPRALTGVTNAEELLQAMQTQGIDVRLVVRWFAGRWLPHDLGSQANNFPITPGEGYFIRNFGNSGTFTLP